MNDNNIDKLFKEQLDHYAYPPSQRVWENVNKTIAYKTSFWRRHRKWIAAAAILTLVLSGATFILHFNNKTPNAEIPKDSTLPVRPFEYSANKKEVNETHRREYPIQSVHDEQSIPLHKTVTKRDKGVSDSEEQFIPQQKNEYKTQYPLIRDRLTSKKPSFHHSRYPAVSGLPHKSGHRLFTIDETPLLLSQPDFTGLIPFPVEKTGQLPVWVGTYLSGSMIYYADSRDKPGYTTGLDFGVKHHNFYAVTGVAWNTFKEEGRYTIDFQSYDSVGYYHKVVSFEVNPQNPEQITYKTEKTTVYDSVTHVNMVYPLLQHTYVSIPLSVGYKFYRRSGFSAAVETGVVYSKLISSSNPEVTLNQPDFKVLSVTRETPLRADINWQWSLALHLDYKLKSGLSLSVQPEFKKYLSTIYISNRAVMPYGMGIRFGIYYNY